MATSGNGFEDRDHKEWLIGHFRGEGHPLYSPDVEIKWQTAPKGLAREEWVTGETRTAISFLFSGKWELEFCDRKVVLQEPGDYAMWGPGEDHRWRALENSLVVTVRWPSRTS